MIVGDASGSWGPYTYYWLNLNGDTLQTSDTHISIGTLYLIYLQEHITCILRIMKVVLWSTL